MYCLILIFSLNTYRKGLLFEEWSQRHFMHNVNSYLVSQAIHCEAPSLHTHCQLATYLPTVGPPHISLSTLEYQSNIDNCPYIFLTWLNKRQIKAIGTSVNSIEYQQHQQGWDQELELDPHLW